MDTPTIIVALHIGRVSVSNSSSSSGLTHNIYITYEASLIQTVSSICAKNPLRSLNEWHHRIRC